MAESTFLVDVQRWSRSSGTELKLLGARWDAHLPADLRDMELKIDVARHDHRPNGRLPAGDQNFPLDSVGVTPRELHDELLQALPTSFSIFRAYSKDHRHDAALHAAVNSVLGAVVDSKTNM